MQQIDKEKLKLGWGKGNLGGEKWLIITIKQKPLLMAWQDEGDSELKEMGKTLSFSEHLLSFKDFLQASSVCSWQTPASEVLLFSSFPFFF